MTPFGYETRERENKLEYERLSEPQFKRIYIEVIATRNVDGTLTPKRINWRGRPIDIKVISSQRGQSLKQRLRADKFLCMFMNKRFHLYYEDGGFRNQRFYLELKEGYNFDD